ncbi:equilibrative nucleobase transporter 1-like [Brevipalpus obovatus]|uniref:equilibrative nucleobase transporter 1-like n=1 Tax=Brevipalpus obovatus TaxID=246614 RepID=UPI003D9FA4C7
METPVWKKRFILIFCLFENLIFSGNIYGWSALNFVLKEERIFSSYCDGGDKQIGSSMGNSSNESYIEYNFEPDQNPFSFATYEEKHPKNLTLPPSNGGEEYFPLWDSSEHDFIAPEHVNIRPSFGLLGGDQPASNLLRNSSQNSSHTKALFKEGNIPICHLQDRLLNLAYTIGTFFNGFTAFIWGFMLDYWGLRTVRLVINFFLTSGSLMLCFTTRDTSMLLFPAIGFLALAGIPLRIADMEIAAYFPKHRSFVITLYSGAFSASAVTFVIMKLLWSYGLPFPLVSSLLVIASLIMLPVTFFMLPKDYIEESETAQDDNPTITFTEGRFAKRKSELSLPEPITLANLKYTNNPRPGVKQSVISTTGGGKVNPAFMMESAPIENCSRISSSSHSPQGTRISSPNRNLNATRRTNHPMKKYSIQNQAYYVRRPFDDLPTQYRRSSDKGRPPNVIPLRESLLSIPFWLHQWWYSWMVTYMAMYVGALNLWLCRVTPDKSEISFFTKLYGITQVSSLIIAPLTGFWLDNRVNKANEEPDSTLRRLKRNQAGFWPLMITSSTLTGIHICRFFDTKVAVHVSIFLITFLRAILVAVGSAFLRIRFPAEHYNKLLGITSTSAAILSLLQFPLFVWEASIPDHAIWINILCCIFTLITYLYPGLLLLDKPQRVAVNRGNSFHHQKETS